MICIGDMNKLDAKTRTLIIRLLLDGNSICTTSRIAVVSKNTITKLLEDAGKTCAVYHDENVRNIKAKHVQADEIWAFCYAKERNVKGVKSAPADAGDIWTWTAMERDSNLIISYTVGDRSQATVREFMLDLAPRLATRIQLTTDGHGSYLKAVTDAFSGDVDFSKLIKQYSELTDQRDHERTYLQAERTGTKKEVFFGNPDVDAVSTSHVERLNQTMSKDMHRFTRLTNSFSKKAENHAYAVALHFMYHNFCRPQKTRRITPAMAAGLADRLWDVQDIVALIEKAEAEATPKKRVPCKLRRKAISN